MSEAMTGESKAKSILSSYLEFRKSLPDTFRLPESVRQKESDAEWRDLSEGYKEFIPEGLMALSDSIFYHFRASAELAMSTADLKFAVLYPLRHILQWAWNQQLPMRGTISRGLCHISQDKSVFFGPPVPKAVRWEELQEWPWISVEPGIASLHEISETTKARFLVPYHVPTKDGPINTYALNPSLAFESQEVCQNLFCQNWKDAYKTSDLKKIRMWSNVLVFFRHCGVKLPGLSDAELALLQ
jgi:hypothetical protein